MIYTTNNCCVAEGLFLSELGALTLLWEEAQQACVEGFFVGPGLDKERLRIGGPGLISAPKSRPLQCSITVMSY